MDENRTPAQSTKEATPVLPSMSAKVYPRESTQEKGSVLAYASVDLGGCFAINGIKIVEGKDGPFVAMPSQMGRDRKYHDVCFPTTPEMREALNAVVMDAYCEVLEQQAARAAQAVERFSARNAKPSLQNALQSATREAAARSALASTHPLGHEAR